MKRNFYALVFTCVVLISGVSQRLHAQIAGTFTVCAGATTTLTDTIGGVWHSGSTAHATVDSLTGVVTGVAGGTASISYVTPATTETVVITVNPLPVAGMIAGAASVCLGDMVTLSDSIAGGTWIVTNPAASFSSGTLTGVSAGMDTVWYIVGNSCGQDTAVKIVTVVSAPVAGVITGSILIFCAGTTDTLTDAAPGGVWTSSNASATVLDGVVTGMSGGADTIRYTVDNGCGIAVAIKTVTINPLPYAGVITGAAGLCVGATDSLVDTVTGGIWSSSDTSASIIGGVISGISVGQDTIKYTVTNGCGMDSTMMVVSIDTLPDAGAITGAHTVCAGVTLNLTDAAPGGMWISSDVGVAIFIADGVLSTLSGGSDIISYSVSNACATVVTMTSVSVNPLPYAGTITGDTSVCSGSSITLTTDGSGGVWASSNPGKATIDASGNVSGLSSGKTDITYAVANDCGTDTARYTVSVVVPGVFPIFGPATVCQGALATMLDLEPGGAWSSSSFLTAAVFGGQVFGVAAGVATITYTLTNACGTYTATHDITVLSTADCNAGVHSTTGVMDELHISPNPNSGAFTLNLVSGADEQATVVITNVVGEKISVLNTITNKTIDISLDVPAGIYFISATTAHGRYSGKVRVE